MRSAPETAQVYCASCWRLVTGRRVSVLRGGGIHPYPHTKGGWLTVKPLPCDGHKKPGQVPAGSRAAEPPTVDEKGVRLTREQFARLGSPEVQAALGVLTELAYEMVLAHVDSSRRSGTRAAFLHVETQIGLHVTFGRPLIDDVPAADFRGGGPHSRLKAAVEQVAPKVHARPTPAPPPSPTPAARPTPAPPPPPKPRVFCEVCGRLINARVAHDGRLFPYPHADGRSFGAMGGRCTGHMQPGRVPDAPAPGSRADVAPVVRWLRQLDGGPAADELAAAAPQDVLRLAAARIAAGEHLATAGGAR